MGMWRWMHVYTKQYETKESAQDVYVEILEREKPQESSNSNYHYVKNTTEKHRGNDLMLTTFT